MNITNQASWASSNQAVAKMGGNGPGPNQNNVAHTLSVGSTTISASWMGMTGTASLTVSDAVVVAVNVTPINPSFAVGTKQQFQAVALFSDNTSQNVSFQCTWSSADASIFGIANNPPPQKGIGTAVKAGTTDVKATYQGVTGSSKVTVTDAVVVSISVSPAIATIAAGAFVPFSAQAIYSDNTSKDVTNQATWISSNQAVADISNAIMSKGLSKALSAGTTTISATYSGVTGTASLTVSAASVVSIELSPIQPTVSVGVPVKFTATAILSDQTSQDVTQIATWTSDDPSIAAVSDAFGSKGLTQTIQDGTTNIHATWSGITGTTNITVAAATLTQIQVTPFAPTLPVGFATSFQATGIYSDNSTQDLTQLATWTSSSAGVAAVSDGAPQKGKVTPISGGQTTISAAFQGVTGSTTVTVSAATLMSIAVTPASASIAVGATQDFIATGTFSDASTLDITTYVTWLSNAPAVAAISNAGGSKGQAKGLSAGQTTITATKGGISGTAPLGVQ